MSNEVLVRMKKAFGYADFHGGIGSLKARISPINQEVRIISS